MIGTSHFLRECSHRKIYGAHHQERHWGGLIHQVQGAGSAIRFRAVASVALNWMMDLLKLYSTVTEVGVDRIGIADRVGCANPRQVHELVKTLLEVVKCDIEIRVLSRPTLAVP